MQHFCLQLEVSCFGRLIFIHHQCWEVLPFCRFQRQRCIKIRVLGAQDFYTPLALKTAKGQHLPALVVYKNQSPMLTAELFCLQSCLGAFCLQLEPFYLQLELSYLQLSFFAYGGKVCLRNTLTDCKERSSTVSNKAQTVSKKTSPPPKRRLFQ